MKVSGKRTKQLTASIMATLVFGGTLLGTSIVDAADKDVILNGGISKYDISPTNKDTNIAVGPNATFFIGGGTQESLLSFGEEVKITWSGYHIHDNQAAKENLPASIAIGQNTYARTGAIEMGSHTLEKNDIAIGDTTAKKLRQFGVASTTLGTNSYTGGGFATNIGSYNVHSSHVETCVLLSHKSADDFISVKMEYADDRKIQPDRITYRLIQEYIEEKYGFKVHTANIAEVKRNLGLPMYDAPNAVEELKRPYKPAPEYKVEAIKDALRHFKVID